jgi:hypothetical protein
MIQKINGGAHGTYVCTEESPDKEGSPDENEGPENAPYDLLRSKHSIEAKEWIEAEVNIGREPVWQIIGGQEKKGGEE